MRPNLLLAQDEGRFGRVARPRSCWAPSGIRPDVPSQIVREDVYAFPAVAPSLGNMCSLILPTADTESMNIFLQEVHRMFSQYFLSIQVDQAGWHHANNLVIPENIRLLKQPPHSPELNPVEHIWDDIREKYFHNCVFQSLDAVIDTRCDALSALSQDPDRVTSLPFFPHLRVVV